MRNLFFDGFVHDWIGIPKQDSADAADPVDVLVSVDVNESGSARFHCIDRRDTISNTIGPSTDQLRSPGNQFERAFIERH